MWKKDLEEALKAARAIAQKAQDEGRNLSPAEVTAFNAEMAKAQAARDEVRESEERFQALAGISDGSTKAGDVLSFKGVARQLKARMTERGDGFNVKALIQAGSTVTTAQTLVSPVSMQQAATGLLDLLPVRFIDNGDEYSYLTQTTRTNNAAPVAVGAVKPTSAYTLTRVSRKLEVIAHLSEPIPEYWLADEPALNQFLSSEMGYGLQLALENQVLNGDGTSPNLRGLLETSGIQTQAFNTSQIRTVRSAITKVEALGYTASGLALNPLDWESIETAGVDEAHYALRGGEQVVPIDRAARRVWGVPVALTTQVTTGTGVLLSDGSAGVVADRRIDSQFGRVGDDFSRNQVRARLEGRFGLEVLKPTGVVEVDLSA